MSHSYSIDNVATSDTDVAVPLLTQASLELRTTVADAKTGVTISTYVLPTGDPAYPMIVTVRNEKSPTAANVERRCSINVKTWARELDDDGVLVAVKPISATVAFNLPPGVGLEAADISDLVGNLYSLTFDSLNTKVPSTALISKQMFGLTELY